MFEENQQVAPQPKSQKHYSNYLITVVSFLMLFSGIIGYLIGIKTEQSKKMPEQQAMIPPASTTLPYPTAKPTYTQTPDLVGPRWQPYISGREVTNVGITLNYPQGWTVQLYNVAGSDYPPKMEVYRLVFDLLPPGVQKNTQSADWMGWGSMDIDVSDKSTAINEWIQVNLSGYKDKLIISQNRMIGNKPAYYLTGKLSEYEFSPRYIVLGDSYSYTIGFSQNGADGFMQKTEKDIFPTLVFK